MSRIENKGFYIDKTDFDKIFKAVSSLNGKYIVKDPVNPDKQKTYRLQFVRAEDYHIYCKLNNSSKGIIDIILYSDSESAASSVSVTDKYDDTEYYPSSISDLTDTVKEIIETNFCNNLIDIKPLK